MSLDAGTATTLVTRYLDTLITGSPADVAALFSVDATVEDPVGGGEVHIGRESIEGFFAGLMAAPRESAELLLLRAGGSEAAFTFSIVVGSGAQRVRIEPIEVMAFAPDGLIAGMKAYWGPGDVTPL